MGKVVGVVLLVGVVLFVLWTISKNASTGKAGSGTTTVGPANPNLGMYGTLSPPSIVAAPSPSPYTLPPLPAYSIGGDAFNIPQLVPQPTQGLTLPVVPLSTPGNTPRQTPQAKRSYGNTSQIPRSYNVTGSTGVAPTSGIIPAIANLFGLGAYANPRGSGTTTVDYVTPQGPGFTDIVSTPPAVIQAPDPSLVNSIPQDF